MPSRYQAFHTGAFLVGLLSFVLALAVLREVFLPLAAACFVVTGVMTIAGHRITMHGPLGGFLRRTIGGAKRGSAYVVGGFWLLLGIALLVASGFEIAREEPVPPEAPVPNVPAASVPADRVAPQRVAGTTTARPWTLPSRRSA